MRRRDLALVVLFCAYAGAVRLGETVLKIDNVSPVWPASGVAVVGLLLLGRRALPVIFLADLTANWLDPHGVSLLVSLGTAAANVIEPVIVVWILHRFDFDMSLTRWRDVATLALASAAGAVVGASVGVGMLVIGDATNNAGLAWRSWAPGDIMGDIALVAFVGVWRVAPNWRLRRTEWMVGLALLIATGLLAFSQDVEMLYLLFPFLLWAPMRFGRHGATAVSAILAIASIAETANGVGPFARNDKVAGLVSLQVFLAILILTELTFAALRHERGSAGAQLRHRALYDDLTDLPNRTLLIDRIHQATGWASRRGTPLAVLFVDLDRFKLVNDGLGPRAGDDVLRTLAERLDGGLPAGDTLGRFGGDQFVLVRDDCGLREAVAAAEQVRGLLGRPVEVGGDEVFVTASIGIAHGNGDEPPEELLRDASAAMARAKHRGGDRFEVHDANARAQVHARLSTETALRRAIESSQLRLHYQPIVSTLDGRIHAFEALVRWQHPKRGLLAPAHFVPLAEETGLILPIGAWVLEEACRQLGSWPDSIGVSVNVSPVQVERGGLLAGLTSVLDEAGCDPGRLIVEITESALARDVVPALKAARELGVRVALDDFGVGYASLGDIRRFPLDMIKLDRSFAAELTPGSRSEAIVDAVARMAGALDLQSVAEGVETEEQLEVVSRLGYGFAQGFHLMRPMDAAAVERLLVREPAS